MSLLPRACRDCGCGLPPHRSVRLVGYTDICLGAANVAILAIYIKKLEDPLPTTAEPPIVTRARVLFSLVYKPVKLLFVVLACHALQFVMGLVLIRAAKYRNKRIAIIWLIVTGCIAIFTGVFIRVIEMVIVYDFTKELPGPTLHSRNPELDNINPNRERRHQAIWISNYRNHPNGVAHNREQILQSQPQSENMNLIQDQQRNHVRSSSQVSPSPIRTISESVENNHNHDNINTLPPSYEQSFRYASYGTPIASEPPPRYEDVLKDG